jgi:predicted transcriptional regulator
MLPTDLWILRQKHNLTCAALAEIVGVHKSQVTRWETGKQKIPQWLENLLRYWEQVERCLDGENTALVPERILKGENVLKTTGKEGLRT